MKKVSKLLAIVLVVAMMGALFAGCGKTNDNNAGDNTAQATNQSNESTSDQQADPIKGKRLGVITIYKGDEWCAGVATGFEEEAKKRGFEINVQDGNLDHETQQKQIENFIAQEYDMILVDPANGEGIGEVLDKAKAAGIPVMGFDSEPVWDNLVSYVAWDNEATGTMSGEYIKKYIEENLGGKANIAILTLNLPHCLVREKAFREVISTMGENVKIVSTQDCQGNREVAANIVANIKEPVDIIFSVVDNGAWGAISSLEAKGVKGTKVFSAGAFGAEPFDALKANHPYYMGCVVVPPLNIVNDCLDIAEAYFRGETDSIPERKNIDIAVYDSSNISEIY